MAMVLGKKWREIFGCVVALEGRDVLVMANEAERIAEKLRDIGAAEVAVIRRAPGRLRWIYRPWAKRAGRSGRRFGVDYALRLC